MRLAPVLTALSLALAPNSGAAQEGRPASLADLSRDTLIVVFSPHFDEPIPPGGALNCPTGPMHLYGFEGDEIEGESSFRVRVFNYDPTSLDEYVFPVDGSVRKPLLPIEATVLLTRRFDGGTEAEMPQGTIWRQSADSTGLAVFEVPPGVYAIRFQFTGVRREEGVLRIREARSDSLHAYLIPGAICEQ
jgi:hypothetical protein